MLFYLPENYFNKNVKTRIANYNFALDFYEYTNRKI